MKKKLIGIVSICFLLFLFACGNQVDDTTSDKYITQAEGVVSLLNEGNYEAVFAQLNDEMKAGLPIEGLKELSPIFEQSGDFEEINKSSVEEDEGIYIVVVAANYSEENRIFTISFNEQEEIAGLYIK